MFFDGLLTLDSEYEGQSSGDELSNTKRLISWASSARQRRLLGYR